VLQGVEKTIVSKMLVEGSNRRTYAVDRHAGIVSGAAADAPVAAVKCISDMIRHVQVYIKRFMGLFIPM
jgi:20S proteasome subunit alpha 7